MIVTAVMTDHPSWLSAGNADFRAVRHGDAVIARHVIDLAGLPDVETRPA